jgi:hypothetical protein
MFLGTLTCHKNINIINEHEELKGRRDGGGMERERGRREKEEAFPISPSIYTFSTIKVWL